MKLIMLENIQMNEIMTSGGMRMFAARGKRLCCCSRNQIDIINCHNFNSVSKPRYILSILQMYCNQRFQGLLFPQIWIQNWVHSPFLPLRSRTSWIQLGSLGSTVSSPAGPVGAWLPNAFWADMKASVLMTFLRNKWSNVMHFKQIIIESTKHNNLKVLNL